jgi:lipopolysaccharide biosynthesis glycosyltransferase
MSIALATMLDSFFIPGYIAFMKSFKKHNPAFSHDLIIFDVGLNEKEREIVQLMYNGKVIFKEPNKDRYKGTNFSRTQECLINTYYKLDIFSLYNYSKVLFLDMDMIVLDNIEDLFNFKYDLAGCPGYAIGSDSYRNGINTGLILVNKPLLNEKTYSKVVNFVKQGFSMPDQKGINRFFKGRINFIDKVYNCEKRMWKGKKNKIAFDNKGVLRLYPGNKKVRIVHYVSQKPWQNEKSDLNKGFEELENLWHEHYRLK